MSYALQYIVVGGKAVRNDILRARCVRQAVRGMKGF